MISDFFINMAFLISFISIGSQFLKKHDFDQPPSRMFKYVIGVFQGCLGIILMIFSVKINSNILVDFRYTTIIMAAIFGGETSVLVCGLFIAIYRLMIFGVSFSSVIATATIIIVTLGCLIIIRFNKTRFQKWMSSTILALILASSAFVILLYGKTNLVYLLIVYWLSTILISFISYYYIRYCVQANSLFRKLQMESTKDFLTGLNNVRSFDDLFNLSVYNSRKKQVGLSLLMIDIDLFKKVNDTYGHQAGDFVLAELAKILTVSCRDSDGISRIGGEEFTVILLDCSKECAITVAEQIRTNVEAFDFKLTTGEHLKITVSVGVSNYPETSDDYDKLLELSDIALYSAKRNGRNKVVY